MVGPNKQRLRYNGNGKNGDAKAGHTQFHPSQERKKNQLGWKPYLG